MSDYIERGALIAFVREARKNLPKESKDFFTRDEMLLNFQQYLELRKAADVEPVVRGYWMEEECFVCSRCGMPAAWAKPSLRKQLKTDYCSSCGAHMERSGSGE